MKINVFVGTGGVGKTSVAAAAALRAALQGQRVLVLTIDPALRLRSALRLDERHLEQEVPLADLGGSGELWAGLMDVRATLDRAVRLHGEPRQAEAVLAHPVYRMLVDSLAGMQELLAVERIDQALAGGFGEIFIDTAPSRHAFEFLDKPEFFSQLVSFPLVRMVGRTYKWWESSFLSKLGRKSAELYSRVEEILGAGLVRQVLDFYSVFRTIAEGYAERAVRTTKLLHDSSVAGFTIVTTPFKAARDADYFLEQLQKRKFAVHALIVNRVWAPLSDARTSEEGPAVLRETLDWYRATVEAQQASWSEITRSLAGRIPALTCLREMPRSVDGLPALAELARALDQAASRV
jgi:anion-transporting  ArsA/GET3 family ATPase